MRKHETDLNCFIRRVERPRYIPYHARVRNPKTLILAVFFGHLLSLVTEGAPPEAFAQQEVRMTL